MLLDRGMAEFTIDGVAARSGASKTTIYKWWPSKGALALAAYFDAVEDDLSFDDTGDVRHDLTVQLVSFVRLLVDSPAGAVIAELIGESQTDPELAAAYRQNYSGPRRALAVERLVTGRTAGQIRLDVEPEVVIDQLWGACYHRLLIPDRELDEPFAHALVDNLFGGISVRS